MVSMVKLRENKFALALVAGLALALVVGVVYSVAVRSRDVTDRSAALDSAHTAVQTATVARSQLELAVYQHALGMQGVGIDPDAIAAAAATAGAGLADSLAALKALAATGNSSPSLNASGAAFVTTAEDLIAGLDGSVPLTTSDLETRYEAYLDGLLPVRDRLIAAIRDDGAASRLVTSLAGFLAVFLIPAAVITTYFVFDRRRRRQHELEVTLKAEHAAHASRERFLTAVSHQLREPLWAVRGISRMLGNDEALMAQPHMSDLHTLLAGELDDMNGLMDNLLTASRLEAGGIDYVMEPVDVREETRAIIESLNHRGAQIYVAMDEGVVVADRRRFSQIMRNLVSNALKYGGPNIEVKGQSDSGTYTVVVVDDGQGVPREVEEALFTRFSLREESQNVGLGLSIVMSLAVGMGGTAFHAREDGLTRFGVRLPISAEAPATARAYEAPAIVPAPEDSD